MEKYDHKKIEKKWQKKWEEEPLHTTIDKNKEDTSYILDMFPYPSGDGLHVGHVESYTATDIYARYERMNGKNVLHPMGWDAFGLPAENYAIKTGIHPEETTKQAANNFRRQIKSIGLSYDWDREIDTHSEDYYKWTQWLFLQLYKDGLAYKKNASVNWCESCKTVLANEQVLAGFCERCKDEVEQRDLDQWFFKITDFADELISGLDKIDWPESTKLNQKNWIGKSEGAKIKFKIKDTESVIEVFTTRPDTLFGATYMVLAPEHPLIEKLKDSISNFKDIESYVKKAAKKTDIERLAEGKEKTGVKLEGLSVINPANNEEIPIFVADYVLMGYGTGAIMAVPAHDERDFEFAKKFELEIKSVILPQKYISLQKESKNSHEKAGYELLINKFINGDAVYKDDGALHNSGKFDSLNSDEAIKEITKHVGGELTTTYKLRDWLVSRQRYWGAPIPIVYDPEGKAHAVPEENLPWVLPTDVEFKPTGVSPLAESKELKERTEKIFGKGWVPEVDTMDTFVCSSWYFFRYTDNKNEKEFASKKAIKKWLPVDLYMGGAEHTVLHLMYSRFITKVLKKLGHIDFDEPFLRLIHQGMILAADGKKMSKSLGNVINPDEVVSSYGADTLRLYEMFMGPLEDKKPWQTQNIIGVRRFLERVWRLGEMVSDDNKDSDEVEKILHKTIKKVTRDIETFSYNTAISQMMIFVNMVEKEKSLSTESYKIFITLLSPFAPHISDELWERVGDGGLASTNVWPNYDKTKIIETSAIVVVQVNGKVRGEFEVNIDADQSVIEEKALSLERVVRHMDGKKPAKIIYVKGKLINIVI